MKRKAIKGILLLLLISVFAVSTVFAAGTGSIRIEPDTITPGGTLTVTFTASGLGRVSSLRLNYTLPEGLEFQSAKWVVDGATLKDIDTENQLAVLAFSEPVTLNGLTDIFTITFLVPEDQKDYFNSEITISLRCRLDSEDLGTITVTEPIAVCSHPDSEVRGYKVATCVSAGYTGDRHCVQCDAVLVAGEEIPATGKHTGGIATCTAQAVCAVCGTSYGEMEPHTVPEQWSSDNTAHWRECTQCRTVMDNRENHTVTWITDKQPTESEVGLKHEECIVCGFRRKEGTEIPKLKHVHTDIRHYSANKATCMEEGNVEYWVCGSEVCEGKFYADSECSTELQTVIAPRDPSNHVGDQEIRNRKQATCGAVGYSGDIFCKACSGMIEAGEENPATGKHNVDEAWQWDGNNHWHRCSQCQTKVDIDAHNFQWVTDKHPTEAEPGIKHEQCSVCGFKRNENTRVEPLAHVHTAIIHHDAVPASCVEEGAVEYWTCGSEMCLGKYYADSNCTEELNTVAIPIDPEAHGETELRNSKEASCGENGYSGDLCCTQCDAVVTAGKVISKTEDHTAGKEWYMDEDYHWHVCTACGEKTTVELHKYHWVVDKAATEESAGEKHEECGCGSRRNEGATIPKLDHTHTGIKHHQAVPATCIKKGTVEYWTCSARECTGKYYADAACQLLLDTIEEPLNKDNHVGPEELKYASSASCGTDGYSGDLYCAACSGQISKGTVIPATGNHVTGKSYSTDDTHHWKRCEVCKAVIGNTKQGHRYAWVVDREPTETSTGTRHQECTVCGHKCNENTIVSQIPHDLEYVGGSVPTCTEDGTVEHYHCRSCGKYYAVENGKAGREIDRSATVIRAKGHTHSEYWQYDENAHWHPCGCGDKGEMDAHQIELIDAREATKTADGYTGDKICSVCGYVISEGEVIPAGFETEPETTVPTEPSPSDVPEQDPPVSEKTGNRMILLVVSLVVAVGAGIGIAVAIWKKRKN